MNASAPAMPAAPLAPDICCAQCRSSIKSMPMDSICPECGHPVVSSLQRMIRFSSPGWAHRVARGMKWIAAATALTALLTAVGQASKFLGGDPKPGVASPLGWGEKALVFALMILAVLALGGLCVGWMMVTSPEPGSSGENEGERSRRWAHRFILTALVGSGVGVSLIVCGVAGLPDAWIADVLGVVGVVILVPCSLVYHFGYLAGLYWMCAISNRVPVSGFLCQWKWCARVAAVITAVMGAAMFSLLFGFAVRPISAQAIQLIKISVVGFAAVSLAWIPFSLWLAVLFAKTAALLCQEAGSCVDGPVRG